jgi:hypothetical protein
MSRTQRRLLWFLRVDAVILLSALLPILFPTEWMAELHERLGLGAFPRHRLTEYLTRSIAACYALHGAVVWLLTTDWPRYRPLIAPVFRLHVVFAAVILGVDLFAGMPVWWVLAESGTIAGFALIVLIVNHKP